MNDLHHEIKQLIIDSLDLEDMTPADIDNTEPLFVDGLGLDSIDALELGLAIKKQYGVTLDASDSDTKRHFACVDNLVSFVKSQQN